MAGSQPASATMSTMAPSSKPSPRRFIGVRQRPSGRWVAEIKDSSQRMRLWLGTFDSPEEAARAYDEAARALRGDNARTNFAPAPPNSDSSTSNCRPSPQRDCGGGNRGLNFSSLKAKLSKNLQSIMARSSESKAAKSRVSDHFTFASIFHRRNYSLIDKKMIEKTVQPSFIVPHVGEDQSWESTSGSESGYLDACESVGFRPHWAVDSDGSDTGEVDPAALGGLLHDQNELVMGRDSEASRSKRFKVSSSVVVPPSFSASESLDGSH